MLRHSVRQPVAPRAAPTAIAVLSFLLLLALAPGLPGCTSGDPNPGPGSGDGHATESDGLSPSSEPCPITCAALACGRYACLKKCEVGSGCKNCVGLPCGSGVCQYGTGCNCAGQPCTSSGCPPGTGCLP